MRHLGVDTGPSRCATTVADQALMDADPGGAPDSRVPIVACMPSEEPRLIGAHELRVRLGIVCRQRVYRIAGRRDFPAAVATLAQGKVWLLSDVEEWIRQHRANVG
jgi:prophage regulatory protein